MNDCSVGISEEEINVFPPVYWEIMFSITYYASIIYDKMHSVIDI